MVTFKEAITNEPNEDEIQLHQEIVAEEASRIAEKYECTVDYVLNHLIGAGMCLLDEESLSIYAFFRSDKPEDKRASFFGGHIEEGEHPVVAAIRETFEESAQKLDIPVEGIKNGLIVPIIELIDNTVSEKNSNGKFFITYIVPVRRNQIDDEIIASFGNEGSRAWIGLEQFKSEMAYKHHLGETLKRYNEIKSRT